MRETEWLTIQGAARGGQRERRSRRSGALVELLASKKALRLSCGLALSAGLRLEEMDRNKYEQLQL